MPAKFKPLTQPQPGWYCWLGPVLLHVNWARTGVWAEIVKDTQRTDYLSLRKIERHVDGRELAALAFCCGPLRIYIGYRDRPLPP